MNFCVIAIGILCVFRPLAPEIYFYCQKQGAEIKFLKYPLLYKSQKNAKIKIIATGYYAPLANQRFFARGDYFREIKMNGLGIQTFT